MEFKILKSGIRVERQSPRHLYFHLWTDQGERWRVIALRELLYLTRQDRDRDDILGRQWAAVRGLYNAGVDFTFAAGGLFKPKHIGVVQWYGSVGEADTEQEAAEEAMCGLEAVQGLLANYPQSRTGDPSPDRLQWYLNFVRNAPRVLVVLGHPDPRMSREGTGQDGAAGASDDDLAREQTEMFLRALVARRKQFVFHVTADYISRHRLADGLVTVARVCSDVASRRRGSIGMGVSVAIPFMAAASQAWTGTRTGGRSVGRSAVDALSESLGQAHTEGQAHTDSQSHSVSDGESWGTADTVGSFSSTSVSKTAGTANTQGTANTKGAFSSSGGSVGSSWGWSNTDSHSSSFGVGLGSFSSHGDTAGKTSGWGVAAGESHTDGKASTDSLSGTISAHIEGSYSDKVPILGGTGTVSAGGGVAVTVGHADTTSEADTTSLITSAMGSTTEGTIDTTGSSTELSFGWQKGKSSTVAGGGSSGSSWSSGSSQSATKSNADTRSQGTTTSRVSGSSSSHTTSHSTSHVESDTWGTADTKSQADTRSHALGRSHADGVGTSEMAGRGGGEIFGGTISRGIVPGVNLNRSWMTEDDVADRVTEVLRGLERVLDAASAEGGFMTQAAIFVEDGQAEKLAAAAVGQAYYGLNTPTPVCAMPVPDEDADAVRQHALACRPCLAVDGDPFGGMLWSKYSTLLTAGMLSAYTRPAWFEEGVATTVQEAEPPYAFYPDLTGEVFMGHQFSFETGELTQAPLLISRDKMFHSMFAADTGFGKSVAAMRMAYETTKKWKFRTLVLEFSTGWRALVNAPGLEGHFQIYQLSPGGSFPMRWNPLEIGRHIDPETQWRAFCDVFGGVARMGVRRQIHDFRRVLKRVYVAAGVLVRDLDVIEDPQWGYVQPDEAGLIGTPADTPIKELSPTALQMIAVHRSKNVGLDDLYAEVQDELSHLPLADRIGRPIMEGIAARLEPLIYGAVGRMFGKGGYVCFSCYNTGECPSGWGEACFYNSGLTGYLYPVSLTCQAASECEPTGGPSDPECIPGTAWTPEVSLDPCEGWEWTWDLRVMADVPPHLVQVDPFPRWLVGMGAPLPAPYESGEPGTVTLQDYPALSNFLGVCQPNADSEGCWSQKNNKPDPIRTDPDTGEEAPLPGDIKDFRVGLRWRRIDIMPSDADPSGAPATCWDWDEREWNIGQDYGYGPIPAVTCGKSSSHIYETSSWGKPKNGPNFIPAEDACVSWTPGCDSTSLSPGEEARCHCCEQVPTSLEDWAALPAFYDFDPDLGAWQNPAYQVTVPTYWALEWAAEWYEWEQIGQDCECECHGGAGSKECHKEGEPESWCEGSDVHSERICEPLYDWVQHDFGDSRWNLVDLRNYGKSTWYHTSWSVRTTGSYAGCAFEYGDPNPGTSVRIPVIEVQSVLRDPCYLDGTCPD